MTNLLEKRDCCAVISHEWALAYFKYLNAANKLVYSEKKKVKSLSHVQIFATQWTVAYQASVSMGFSRQEYWKICYFIGYHSYALSIFNCIPFLFIDRVQTGSWSFNLFIYVSSLYLLYMVFSQMHIELRAERIKGWVNICFVKFVLKLSFVVLMIFLTLMVLHIFVLLACISWSLLVILCCGDLYSTS